MAQGHKFRGITVGKTKIPKNAKRVFKGVIFDVYQWRQKLFDGSYATFEAVRRNDTVLVIPIIGGKIALTVESQPRQRRHNGLIGGRIEHTESPLAAAKRELLEESGMKSDDWKLIGSMNAVESQKIEWRVYLYAARNCRKVASQRLEPGERISIRTVSIDEFVSMVTAGKNADSSVRQLLPQSRSIQISMAKLRRMLFN